jgi:hypothetical protein
MEAAEAVPVEPPQEDFVVEVVNVIGAGLLKLNVALPAHPELSVTVTLYVPEARLLAVTLDEIV